ncbi:uncharacterized protein LOC110462814 [Mizuhopecten yessoensis]|uniref:Nucleotide-diphospho-sugar transferase domain-containing protein n=1 Tax=Mizuhopecten yessoensis TaxID=6573 RepID=A0A210PXK2_MIZYE|nr:uncharacterized protein LOC110462814 [Mizuhopecten yessoensis]OWF41189.1 hypothetical protein KP79_PYT09833 [Mizuhopecten yessoensis]
MSKEAVMQKFLAVVAVLGAINLFVFLVSWKGLNTKPQCSLNSFLQMSANFIASNGKHSITEHLSESCPNSFLEKEAASIIDFRKTVRDLIHECNSRRLLFSPHGQITTQPILTLFTSWINEKHVHEVHKKTLANWSRFSPKFTLVLFTNDSVLSTQAEEYGWKTYPIMDHAAGGAPVLKAMFQTVIENINSTFYGYANSDILFTDALPDSLDLIAQKFKSPTSVFISGIRTNVPNVSLKEAASFPNIAAAANVRGKLFEIHSADYFFTTKWFPWADVPPLVIGRRAYDNYIVSHARRIKATVIDATETVPAIHQTTAKGNQEGITRPDADYNDKYLVRLGITPKYESGFVTCAEWKLYETLCGDIDIVQRQSLPKYCAIQ